MCLLCGYVDSVLGFCLRDDRRICLYMYLNVHSGQGCHCATPVVSMHVPQCIVDPQWLIILGASNNKPGWGVGSFPLLYVCSHKVI